MPLGTARDLVFLSYSHANPEWRDKVLVLLKPFVRQGQLEVWADPYIKTGDTWQRKIDQALARTRVGVVLLTPDLLASDFIAEVELPYLLRAARAGDVTLVVVPIERHVEGSTGFSDGDLMEFQWPWPPHEPIAELDDRGRTRALASIAKAIVDGATMSAPPASVGIVEEHRSTETFLTQSDRLGALHGVPALPPHHIPRAHERDALKRALLDDTVVVGVSGGDARVGVHGQGGLGKSVLAASVACDDDVRRTFPDGIFWIPIGQQPHLESLQAELAERLGGGSSIKDVGAGTRLLQQRLSGRACLVVLDDVWQLVHAKAFDALDPRSRLLVTTRDRSLLTALGARDMRLDAFSPDAALDLMARWAGIDAPALPAVARDVAKEVDYLPLGLSLAGAQVRDGCSWADLLASLQAGRLDFLDHPYGSVFASIASSVDALPVLDALRYAELAVFPEDASVPVAVVETLWSATGGLKPRDARALVSRLASRSLLSLSQVVTLHDLQHDFVRLTARDLPGLHGKLVDAWRATVDPDWTTSANAGDLWAGLPESPEYPWHYLTYHLDQAGRHDEMEHVLTSAEWLRARLTRFTLPPVLDDFRPALGHPALRTVRDALRLSAHVLSKDPEALIGQLRGRLLGTSSPDVQRLIESRPRAHARHPSLRPRFRCLTAPGGPLLQTFEGHTGWVEAVAVLPDGQRALSGSQDGTLKLWDLASGAVLQTFEGHASSVKAVTVLPDGQRAVSASDDRTLKLWDLTSGAVLRTFEGHTGWVMSVTALPDGQRALSCGEDGTLKLWDLTSGAVLRTFEGHTGWVMSMTALHDGRRVLSGGRDGTLKLWDLTSGAVLRTIEGHTGWVWSMTVLPDGQRALSTTTRRLEVWDLTSGAILQTFEGHTGSVMAVSVLPDGRRAVSGGEDRTLKLWDMTPGAVLQNIEGHTSSVSAVTVLPDGQRVVAAYADGTFRLWDLTSGACLRTFEGHTGWVMAVTVLPDGGRALSVDIDGTTLKLWDLTSGAVLQTFEGHTAWESPHAIMNTVLAVTVLPDGQRALSGSGDGTLKLWDLTSGALLQAFEGRNGPIAAVTVLPDGRRALLGTTHGALTLWDLTSGAALQTFEGHTGAVTVVTVLPDGLRVLSGSGDGTLKLWDLTSGVVLQTFEGHTSWVKTLTVLPDSRCAVSGSDDRTLRLWDLKSGELLATFHGDALFTALAHTHPRGVVAGDNLGRLHAYTIENL